ncbi:right-handed parallel beta-helix repeat-containing protein [Caldalkalibacillus mannanilyticus]|uniref:right-handed parallel beta-helix repeat-containing protein n=1 Tax=Caldalkalibacillus mannanilyticus TaxID=1418 RepID=UPI0004692DE1|nr:right-handed parallel beta-helix repeat-containing protein [Caldalkalibacillus mannanilyticus]
MTQNEGCFDPRVGNMEELGTNPRSLTTTLIERGTNVKDFGAKGDGVTDDIEAFRAAVEATPAGGTLYIPPADFFYLWNPERGHNGKRSCLVIDKPMRVISAENALIKYADLAKGFVGDRISSLIRISSSSVTLNGLQINCNTDNLYLEEEIVDEEDDEIVDGEEEIVEEEEDEEEEEEEKEKYKYWFASKDSKGNMPSVKPIRTDIILVDGQAKGLKNITIKNCQFEQGHTVVRFLGAFPTGYDMTNEPDDNVITDCIIHHNTFERFRGNAINLSGGVRRIVVSDNRFLNGYYHAYRNYWVAEKCIVKNNYFYRDLKEMLDWYSKYDNRFYTSSNPDASLYHIVRGHLRIGDGRQKLDDDRVLRDIQEIEVSNNTFVEKTEGVDQALKDKWSTEIANIQIVATNGGHIIKNNTILGGAYGIAYNISEGPQPKTTVIENNYIKDTYKKAVDTKCINPVDIRIRNNTVLNSGGTDLEYNEPTPTLILAANNSSQYHKNIAKVVCNGTNDQITITKAINEFFPSGNGRVMFLSGTYKIDDVMQIHPKNIILEGLSLGVIFENSTVRGLSFRSENGAIKNITFRNTMRTSGRQALEVRGTKNVLIDNIIVENSDIGIVIRGMIDLKIVNSTIQSNNTGVRFYLNNNGDSNINTLVANCTVRGNILGFNITEEARFTLVNNCHFINNTTAHISGNATTSILGTNFFSTNSQ